jgi:hypothetical protein
MKIAIAIAGSNRNIKQSINNYKKHLFDGYDVDIFLCLDSDNNIDLYEPYLKKYKIVDHNPEWHDDGLDYWFYKKKICMEMVINHETNNNFKYDYVFLTRPDLLFKNKIEFYQFKRDCFYVEPHCPNLDIKEQQEYVFYPSDSQKLLKKEFSTPTRELIRQRIHNDLEEFYLNNMNPYNINETQGSVHPNYYLSNSKNIYNLCDIMYSYCEIHSKMKKSFEDSTPHNIFHAQKRFTMNYGMHHFNVINFFLTTLIEDDVIFSPNLNPITIWHQCAEKEWSPSDRKYTRLGFPDYFKDEHDFIHLLKKSIKEDTIL